MIIIRKTVNHSRETYRSLNTIEGNKVRPAVPVDKSAYHPVISSHILLEKRSPHFIPAEQSILKVSALYNSEFNAYSRRARYKTQVLAEKEISAMAPETRLNASNSDDGGANVDEGNVALPKPLAVSLNQFTYVQSILTLGLLLVVATFLHCSVSSSVQRLITSSSSEGGRPIIGSLKIPSQSMISNLLR